MGNQGWGIKDPGSFLKRQIMDEKERTLHFVCTRDQAWNLTKEHQRFWASNCGCREGREGGCRRSRMDLCLMFRDDIGSSGSGKREVFLNEVKEFFHEAEEKHLVTRPFRDEETRRRIEGICFCCDDCCGYFLDADEVCDKGDLVEKTGSLECTNCGDCAEACYFGARKMEGNDLVVNHDSCYGCGLCLDVCPEDCIQMVPRER
jgi:ferredoxin